MKLVRLLSTIGIIHGGLSNATKRPNIVFILTDNQDVHMNSFEYMPHVQKHLIQQGTSFERHYCTLAICCPSRVNLWTGQMAHNTNVTDVSPPYGGYPKFVANGYNDNHLALWMQQSGYNTYYTGKLFNAHTTDNYDTPLVKGFTGSEFLLDPFTYQYYNAITTRNGERPINHAGKYSPDLTAESAYSFVQEAIDDPDTPFLLTVAPVAPHADVTLYPEIVAGPPKWVSQLDRLNDTIVDYNDEYQRCRLRALQSVDEMVEGIIHRLDDAGILDSTYIFYSSDNGYHIGQHRMHPGKECGFETDINVPLIVRGPGLAAGISQRLPTSHTDLAPTIMKLAGNALGGHSFDGAPLPLSEIDVTRQEHVGVEFWGLGVPEGRYGYSGKYQFVNGTGNAYVNNTYK
ncbi:hypothetical protein ACJ41O_014480 [Fusarium nematophilum]